jgi:hypothetical protein
MLKVIFATVSFATLALANIPYASQAPAYGYQAGSQQGQAGYGYQAGAQQGQAGYGYQNPPYGVYNPQGGMMRQAPQYAQGYAPQAYPQPGYAQPGYAQPGYAQPSYGAPTYAQSLSPEQKAEEKRLAETHKSWCVMNPKNCYISALGNTLPIKADYERMQGPGSYGKKI